MRGQALAFCILGIFVLLALGSLQPAHVLSLEGARVGEPVLYEGFVTHEIIRGSFHILSIGNETIVCHCRGSYQGKTVRVRGVVQLFDEKRQLSAWEIVVIR